MPQLERLRVYPIKGLRGVDVEAATVLDGGTLRHDREFALFDGAGEVVNGKRTDRVHELRPEFGLESGDCVVRAPDGDELRWTLGEDADRAGRWFSEAFDLDVTVKRDSSLGYVDRREMGPSVVSTATIETVASWFDELTVESVRRRLRANVEVSGVPAFWEDRFVGDGAPTFAVGSVRFEGVTPCGRCVVPQRDPDTGELTPDFRERFVERRRETFPDWADPDAFDHHYSLMIITSVPAADRGDRLRVGDAVSVSG